MYVLGKVNKRVNMVFHIVNLFTNICSFLHSSECICFTCGNHFLRSQRRYLLEFAYKITDQKSVSLLTQLRGLRKLYVFGFNFDGKLLFGVLQQLRFLTTLNVSMNHSLWANITSPPIFPPQLQSLNVEDTRMGLWLTRMGHKQYTIKFPKTLRYLDASDNQFLNNIQTEKLISELHQLRLLKLSSNNIGNSMLNHKTLLQLKYLDAAYTRIDPYMLPLCPKLEILFACYPSFEKRLTNIYPNMLCSPNLQKVFLTGKMMGTSYYKHLFVPVFCTNIVHLHLPNNNLTPDNLKNITCFKNLKTLNLSCNKFGFLSKPIKLFGLKKLEVLLLNNSLSNDTFNAGKNMFPLSLKVLHVQNNGIKQIPAFLEELTQLTELYLDSNWGLNLAHLPPYLIKLNLSYCGLTHKHFYGCQVPETLKILNIFCNNIRYLDDIFVNTPNLTKLDIGYNQLDQIIKGSFCVVPKKLNKLCMMGCGIEAKSLPKLNAMLQGCQELTYLDLSGNLIYPCELSRLFIPKQLRYLDLRSYVHIVEKKHVDNMMTHTGLCVMIEF